MRPVVGASFRGGQRKVAGDKEQEFCSAKGERCCSLGHRRGSSYQILPAYQSFQGEEMLILF
jgi:hypothetical protein